MQFSQEQAYLYVAFASSVLGIWSILSAKMTKQENRNTILEKDIENLKEFKDRIDCVLEGISEEEIQERILKMFATDKIKVSFK